LRSRKIALGSTAIGTLKGGVYLLIIDGKAAKNSWRLALKYKKRFSCELVICRENLEEVVNKPECKLAAILDKSLADAILSSVNDSYELYTEGGD